MDDPTKKNGSRKLSKYRISGSDKNVIDLTSRWSRDVQCDRALIGFITVRLVFEPLVSGEEIATFRSNSFCPGREDTCESAAEFSYADA